jgi:cell division septation protein DedD
MRTIDQPMESGMHSNMRSSEYMDSGVNPNMRSNEYTNDYPGMGRHIYQEIGPGVGGQPEAPHDLTLGLGALTGIFLAVVLVCAVFFGFGYSTGRTWHSPVSAATPAAGAPSQTDTAINDTGSAAAATPPLESAQSLKPSPGAPMIAASPESSASAAHHVPAEAIEAPGEEAGFPPDSQPQPQTQRTAPPLTRTALSPYAGPASASQSATAAATTLAPSVSAATPATPVALMVQIAAVSRQADAGMLADALRTNGYAPVVHTDSRDSLLHVQVGPFSSLEQARAMRARLKADGYNAFIKP